MKRFSISLAAVLLVLCAASISVNKAQARRGAQTQRGSVCGDPTQPCRTAVTFEAHDLSFRVKENSVIWESEMFYAVILKSFRPAQDDCNSFVSEDERLKAQALFPKRKVFTSRCPEPAVLYYTNVDDNVRFMAVYAGATQAEAARMLETVKATGKFSGAYIRRMRVAFNGT